MNSTETLTDQLGLPAAVVTELLSSRRRCLLVLTLAQQGESAVVDLAARLAADAEREPAAVDETQTERIRQEIYDHHLPKLTATGIVEYDSVLGKVRLAEPAIVPAARRVLKQ
jgi:hypothetical protein